MMRPGVECDLVHSLNHIPLGRKPFVLTFENHLPRYWLSTSDRLFQLYTGMLKHERCRAIIAMSHYAAKWFVLHHARDPDAELLLRKLSVIYPNIHVGDQSDLCADDPCDPLRVTFVGRHFGRKGGCVAVRMAERAAAAKLPVQFTVISSLEVGNGVWTDPPSAEFFERYLRLLHLPNVKYFPEMANKAVSEVLARSHFSLLTTFSDTFGFSAIEGMARWTPPIATPQGALPEFVSDGETGLMVDLPVSKRGEWVHIRAARQGASYERTYSDSIEQLAEQALGRIISLIGDSRVVRRMRQSARRKAVEMFDTRQISPRLDAIYDRAMVV